MKLSAQMQTHFDAAIAEAIAGALADNAVRVNAILRSAEAEGRRDLAIELALSSTLSADSAISLLGKAPRENVGGDRFMQAMGREGALGLDSSGASAPGKVDKKAARAAELKDAANHVRASRFGLPAKV
jgi:hypothetical protein